MLQKELKIHAHFLLRRQHIYSSTNCKHCPSANLQRQSERKRSPARSVGSTPLSLSHTHTHARRHTHTHFTASPSYNILSNLCVCRKSSFVRGPDRIKTVDPRARKLAVNRCLEAWTETLCRDRAWRRGLGAIWGTDCWNGCSHWCKVHPLFGLLPDSASNQWLLLQTFHTLSWTRVKEQETTRIC